MPNRALNNNDNFETLDKWLKLNIGKQRPFTPFVDNLKTITKEKGIYVWLMDKDAYDEIGILLKIYAIKSVEFEIEGLKYHLVYIGTGGVRNNKNGENKSNIFDRINWHLIENKDESAVLAHPMTMSTFRRTVVPLFSNDLLENNAQDKLDFLFKKYFKIYFIPYGYNFLMVKDIINSDEEILIRELRPIFNLKKNNNANMPNHITSFIQTRRNKVEVDTLKRLGNSYKNIKDINSKSKLAKTNISNLDRMKAEIEINKSIYVLNINKNGSAILTVDGVITTPVKEHLRKIIRIKGLPISLYVPNGKYKRDTRTLAKEIIEYYCNKNLNPNQDISNESKANSIIENNIIPTTKNEINNTEPVLITESGIRYLRKLKANRNDNEFNLSKDEISLLIECFKKDKLNRLLNLGLIKY